MVATELDADRMAVAAQPALLAVGEATGQVERTDDLSAEVVLAQLRSVVADLLLLTGMDQLESTDALPPPRGTTDGPTPGAARGCCTSTSTSSSRRSRCCAAPSWPGCRSWSAVAATRPSAAWSPPRRTTPASTASAPGMPLRIAARKCPDAVFLPVDRAAYDEASARVMATLRGAGVGRRAGGASRCSAGTRRSSGRARGTATWATRGTSPQRIRDAVLAATGLHCSVGIGDNKLRAKIATDFGKTGGATAPGSAT